MKRSTGTYSVMTILGEQISPGEATEPTEASKAFALAIASRNSKNIFQEFSDRQKSKVTLFDDPMRHEVEITIPIGIQDTGFWDGLMGCDARRKPQRYPTVSRGFATPQRAHQAVPKIGILSSDGYICPYDKSILPIKGRIKGNLRELKAQVKEKFSLDQ